MRIASRLLSWSAVVGLVLSCGGEGPTGPGPVATQLGVVVEPASTAQNSVALAQQPVIQLRAADGDPVHKSGVSITAGIGSGGGTLTGTTTLVTGSNGQVTFTDLKITGVVGPRTLEFSAADLASVSSGAIALTPGPAAKLGLAIAPSAAVQVGVAFGQQPVAQVQDVSGNAIAQGGVSVTAGLASGGGTLVGTKTIVTGGGGQAAFAGLSITGLVGSKALQFTAAGLASALSGPLTLAAGPAVGLGLTTQPADTARSGVVLGRQPVIQVIDVAGNAVMIAGTEVDASIGSGGGSLAGSATITSDGSGVATFTDLALTGEGTNTLRFDATSLTGVAAAPTTLPSSLSSGTTLPGLTGASGTLLLYVIDVTAGQDHLVVSTTGGSGDINLYVRSGELPSAEVNDCARVSETTLEVCVLDDPAPGPWYILLQAASGYNGVTLQAEFGAGPGCTLVSPGDADQDRLPDCAETGTHTYVSETKTGTDPNVADTDGDGILDGDEVLGSLGGLDLPALGASPLHRDILIEYDWFDDALECAPHSHRPGPGAISRFTNAMAAPNTPNPDGTTGIHVISDYGQGGMFNGGNLINDADGVLSFGVLSGEYVLVKQANLAPERVGYFHYMVLPHRYNTNSGSSGQAELPGDDMIVSLYCVDSDELLANTIMHELGHNLFLQHGGDIGVNYKPNYNSVMNYLFQFAGVDDDCTPNGDGVLDYSTGTHLSLNENGLVESQGICGNPPGPGWDWNGDGTISVAPYALDLNGDGGLGVLNDYNDWGNVRLEFLGSGREGAPPFAPPQIISCPTIPAPFPTRRR